MGGLALAGCTSVAPPPAGPMQPKPGASSIGTQPPSGERTAASVSPDGPGPRAPSASAGPRPAPPPEDVATAQARGTALSPDGPAPSAPGERWLLIESTPSGATVVVDGVPVGRTPYRLSVTETARGFFREETTVRVRFVATSSGERSATVAETFSPTDRVPERVIFTPEGARRVW